LSSAAGRHQAQPSSRGAALLGPERDRGAHVPPDAVAGDRDAAAVQSTSIRALPAAPFLALRVHPGRDHPVRPAATLLVASAGSCRCAGCWSNGQQAQPRCLPRQAEQHPRARCVGIAGATCPEAQGDVVPALTDEERATLSRWARRRTSSQALALRCRIVLACVGATATRRSQTGWGLQAHRDQMARAVPHSRLEGLADEPRRGAARTITDEQSNWCWLPPWRPHRLTPTGRRAAWPATLACRSRPSAGSGGPWAEAAPGRHLQAVD
jgi:hypothetical protein